MRANNRQRVTDKRIIERAREAEKKNKEIIKLLGKKAKAFVDLKLTDKNLINEQNQLKEGKTKVNERSNRTVMTRENRDSNLRAKTKRRRKKRKPPNQRRQRRTQEIRDRVSERESEKRMTWRRRKRYCHGRTSDEEE